MTPNTTKREAREVLTPVRDEYEIQARVHREKAELFKANYADLHAGQSGAATRKQAIVDAIDSLLALADNHAAQSAGVEPVAKPLAYVLTKNGEVFYHEDVPCIGDNEADLQADEHQDFADDDGSSDVFAAVPVYTAPQPDDRDRVIAELRAELAASQRECEMKRESRDMFLADLTEARAQVETYRESIKEWDDACGRLTAQVEAMRADAERYRFVRSCKEIVHVMRPTVLQLDGYSNGFVLRDGFDLDTSIDSAIARSRGGETP